MTGCGSMFKSMGAHALSHTVCESACADMHMNTSVVVMVINCNQL